MCDRCKTVYAHTDNSLSHFAFEEFVHALFFRRPHPVLPDLCEDCEKEVAPLIYVLKDIDALTLVINNFERKIKWKQKSLSPEPQVNCALC